MAEADTASLVGSLGSSTISQSEAPSRSGAAAGLARAGIGAVIDVTLEDRGDAEEFAACGVDFLHLPTEDVCAVSQDMLDRGVAFARRAAGRQRKLLIHCEHGIGRAPLVALCVLVDRGLCAARRAVAGQGRPRAGVAEPARSTRPGPPGCGAAPRRRRPELRGLRRDRLPPPPARRLSVLVYGDRWKLVAARSADRGDRRRARRGRRRARLRAAGPADARADRSRASSPRAWRTPSSSDAASTIHVRSRGGEPRASRSRSARSLVAAAPKRGDAPDARSRACARCRFRDAIRCKTAEGFAFYAVYPESYAAAAAAHAWGAAARWCIGLRSIGTSLAAVVAAQTRRRGRSRVRPCGHPFRRELRPSRRARGAARARTPAASPSSTRVRGSPEARSAPPATSSRRSGSRPAASSSFPSHAGDLGPQASRRHRERWSARHPAGRTARRLPPPAVAGWFADVDRPGAAGRGPLGRRLAPACRRRGGAAGGARRPSG